MEDPELNKSNVLFFLVNPLPCIDIWGNGRKLVNPVNCGKINHQIYDPEHIPDTCSWFLLTRSLWGREGLSDYITWKKVSIWKMNSSHIHLNMLFCKLWAAVSVIMIISAIHHSVNPSKSLLIASLLLAVRAFHKLLLFGKKEKWIYVLNLPFLLK